MKFLPYRLSTTRISQLLYLPIKKGGFGLMNLVQQVQGRRDSYIKELLLFSTEANPNTRHIIHDIFAIQLQVLTNAFLRSEATGWFIENQINGEFGNSRVDEIDFETVNNFVNTLALSGYVTNDCLISIPYYFMLLPNLQLLRYINSSTFRNSSKSFLDRPFAYKFNVSYFRRKKAAQEAVNRTIQERNAFDPNELTADYMLNRPNVWVEPALEEPNDQFMVKVSAPSCLYYDTLFEYVNSWFFIVDSKYTYELDISSLNINVVHHATHGYPTGEFIEMLTKVEDKFTEMPLELMHFQHVHKRLNNAKPYMPFVHEKWNIIYPLTSEHWSSFFKKLGTLRIVMPFFVECYYQLQVGLLNYCLHYPYCLLCSNVKDDIPGGLQHVLFECQAVDRIWTWVTGFDTSKRTPLTLIANANLKGEELMRINKFLFCLIKLAGEKFSKIEYQKPGDPPPVVLQDGDIAMMLQRIRNDSCFWINRGLRQGFGTSASTFNLAIEPLLRILEQKLAGILYCPLDNLGHFSLQTSEQITQVYSTKVKAQSYTDDLASYAKDFNDIKLTLELAKQFGSFSGLQITRDKSIVFTRESNVSNLQRQFYHLVISNGSHNSVTIKSIESNPVCLGVPIIKFDWTVKLKSLLDRLKRILFMGVSLTQRAVAVNTYIYSTLYFFDQHDPIPDIQLISLFLPYKVVNSTLQQLWHTPINKDGLGLVRLAQQVQGRRAKYIYELMTASSNESPMNRHVIHDMFAIQLQVLADTFLRNEAAEREIKRRILEQFGTRPSNTLNVAEINGFILGVRLPGVAYTSGIYTTPFLIYSFPVKLFITPYLTRLQVLIGYQELYVPS
ncbi:unnamed protein product [Ambrosiozyma monospora]|uniref:Unnamed protein product n=1 Tax=Ambrosiozyma monospora TaxID=43982 RepID=A0ACB5SXZ5_AMBMO|nr:unnamed protein product [Ambrosiozyma monospora]